MSFERINPEALGAPRGWTNGMLSPAGSRTLFVAGQTAPEDMAGRPLRGLVEQFGGALDRVLEIVRAAGGDAESVARLTVYVTDMDAYRSSLKALGAAYRSRMGHHYPAMALVEVSSLVDPGAEVEIEATAAISPR